MAEGDKVIFPDQPPSGPELAARVDSMLDDLVERPADRQRVMDDNLAAYGALVELAEGRPLPDGKHGGSAARNARLILIGFGVMAIMTAVALAFLARLAIGPDGSGDTVVSADAEALPAAPAAPAAPAPAVAAIPDVWRFASRYGPFATVRLLDTDGSGKVTVDPMDTADAVGTGRYTWVGNELRIRYTVDHTAFDGKVINSKRRITCAGLPTDAKVRCTLAGQGWTYSGKLVRHPWTELKGTGVPQ